MNPPADVPAQNQVSRALPRDGISKLFSAEHKTGQDQEASVDATRMASTAVIIQEHFRRISRIRAA